ncbi:hypothetical protein CNMCM8927_008970 [Aspergillus lentulus]|uniref:Nephrocystin 3-like N-terminal domain-containing protein n=1 Tax=Aspergillus lentulus TaxID=293939 RepID=A0AAN5YKT8_ASPLE|nr:hypothetical protein CNMCM8060_005018 [Aspergillus lentulus]KAF4187355.1 hypothetical protein CNMCM7927_004299 [Aspergillus lentulus]KAF4198928.1 hypothetical protein CNMCM8694_007534 [Aspergillus lentulus]KAF4203292.1 hypothetical protein CNMCM8927_008970 [Aspergillus lentulus]
MGIMLKQDKVPIHSDAIYDTVPKDDQLLKVEFLEVAPTPIVADRVFFVYLRGYLPKEPALLEEGLVDATLSVSGSVVYLDGSYMEPRSFTIPLKTISINDAAHFVTRDSNGTQVDYIPSSGRSDLLISIAPAPPSLLLNTHRLLVPYYNTMSGAEALTVFGLVCNVMQVIGFVQDGAHLAKAIYKYGSLDPNLAQTSDYIKEGLERLRDSLEKGRPLVQDEKELLDIAKGSLKTAEELKVELDNIAGTAAKGKHSAAFRGWLKAALGGKRRKIERLEKVMHDRQQVLESRLIARICSQNDALLLEQQVNFNSLDRALQGFIECCARNQTTLDQLIQRGFLTMTTHIDSKLGALEQSVETSLSSGRSQLQDNILSRLQELTHNRIEKEEHERLLGSLHYETMKARRNHIIANHDDTFSWIFHPQRSNSDANNQDGFVEWLQFSRQRLFWINGKAGSGKSVLMKFLVDNPRTQSILNDANGTTIVLSHFLWFAGKPLERNMKGLLCSLIYQLLDTKPDICRVVLEKVPTSRRKRFPGDWSTNELFAVFVDVVPACGQHFCIFLDGVDEMDDYMALFGLLDQLCSLPRLQVCVSSRPEPALQRRFHSYPQFRVQDLTRLDIEKYAHDTLQRLYVEDAETISRLVSTICSKADGVFLWVALALRSIQTGHDNHDSPAELEEQRLNSLPNDLNTLYQQMWRRLNDSEAVYLETAARYFNLMLECVGDLNLTQTASPLLFALALQPGLAAAVVTEDIESWEEALDRECEMISKRLPIRCAGLLEVTTDGTVTLIHRSAQEFLMNTPEGQRIRRADPSPREARRLNLMRGLLGCCKLEIEAKAQTLPPRILNLCQPLGRKYTIASMFFGSCRDNLSPESAHELLSLAQALYSMGEWVFDNSFYLHPDFIGAVARAGFFTQARAGFAQLAGDAPHGKRISTRYQAYILESVFDAVKWGQITSAQDLAFLRALGNTSSIRYAGLRTIDFHQSLVETVGDLVPPFYLTGDPLEILLEASLDDDLPGRYNSLDLMISLLEGGYNPSNRRVILLDASAPELSDIFRYRDFAYPEFFQGGTLLIEVNTSFLLTLLKTVVEDLTTLPVSRLRAFVPEYTRADGMHPENSPAEEDFQDVHGGYGDSEDEQSDEEDLVLKEDSDCDYYERNESERRAWASSTDVLIPCPADDSNAVHTALSGDIFTSIALGTDGCLLGKLDIPDFESRLRQILSNARRSTVQELEKDLIRDELLVPWSLGPDFWPPKEVYSDCDEVEA